MKFIQQRNQIEISAKLLWPLQEKNRLQNGHFFNLIEQIANQSNNMQEKPKCKFPCYKGSQFVVDCR